MCLTRCSIFFILGFWLFQNCFWTLIHVFILCRLLEFYFLLFPWPDYCLQFDAWLLKFHHEKHTKKINDRGQRESNRFMPTPVHFWHLPACKVSFLVTLKHHPGQGLSLTWQFAAVFTRLPWMQRDQQTLVCPQLLSVVSKESTLRPSCCI